MQEMPSHPAGSPKAGTDVAVAAIILADEPGEVFRRGASQNIPPGSALVRQHRQMLAASCAVIVLSFILTVRSDEHAAFSFLPQWPIPATCPSQILFHFDCPGCGLTRSFIFLAHGDWQAAFARNRAGWLLAIAVLLQIPYRLFALLGRNPQPLGTRLPEWFGFLLIAALIGNWALRLLGV